LPFWGLLLPFWETPESFDKTFFRHLRGVYLNEISTKSKEICPGFEEQEGQHFTDGTDGPSIPLILHPQSCKLNTLNCILNKYDPLTKFDMVGV